MATVPAEQLQSAIVSVFHDVLNRFPPTYAPQIVVPAQPQSPRLGEYLLELGYVNPRHLHRALAINEQAKQRTTPLGFVLVASDLVPSQVVSVVLLQQFLDRLTLEPHTAPRFIGEQLLIESQLDPEQLAIALQEQLDSYAHGSWVRLGDLIVRHGWLDSLTINDYIQKIKRSE